MSKPIKNVFSLGTAEALSRILTFVLTSMAALGFSLTVRQVTKPLSEFRLVGLGLAANFVLAPAAAWGVAAVLGLSDSLTLRSRRATLRIPWVSWCC